MVVDDVLLGVAAVDSVFEASVLLVVVVVVVRVVATVVVVAIATASATTIVAHLSSGRRHHGLGQRGAEVYVLLEASVATIANAKFEHNVVSLVSPHVVHSL